MMTQPLFGYVNERFGIIKMTILSLGLLLLGVYGFIWAPNPLWLTIFMVLVLICFERDSSYDGNPSDSKSICLWEDSSLGDL